MSEYWLVKQEPEDYGWEAFAKDGRTEWTGVRNFLARNHLRAMREGDGVFYYHSGEERAVVGLARVTRAAFPDPTASEGDWSAVELMAEERLPLAVTLQQIKGDPVFSNFALVKMSRLSVMPVAAAEAARLLQLAGVQNGRAAARGRPKK